MPRPSRIPIRRRPAGQAQQHLLRLRSSGGGGSSSSNGSGPQGWKCASSQLPTQSSLPGGFSVQGEGANPNPTPKLARYPKPTLAWGALQPPWPPLSGTGPGHIPPPVSSSCRVSVGRARADCSRAERRAAFSVSPSQGVAGRGMRGGSGQLCKEAPPCCHTCQLPLPPAAPVPALWDRQRPLALEPGWGRGAPAAFAAAPDRSPPLPFLSVAASRRTSRFPPAHLPQDPVLLHGGLNCPRGHPRCCWRPGPPPPPLSRRLPGPRRGGSGGQWRPPAPLRPCPRSPAPNRAPAPSSPSGSSPHGRPRPAASCPQHRRPEGRRDGWTGRSDTRAPPPVPCPPPPSTRNSGAPGGRPARAFCDWTESGPGRVGSYF